jgi:signal transduction histidine kinase
VAEQIPPAEPARDLLEQALERADQVLVEGRDRVRNLRGETGRGELAYLIEAAAYRLRVDPDVVIDMFVEGDCRQVHPVVCDDLLAIASEALFNAFKHAQATRIDIGLACGRGGLRLRIADNGIGFDPSILKGAGRPGHYGLLGMYERAHKLKAELIIRNCDEGAEIQLLVPGHIAYVGPRRRWSPFPRSADLES